jgi:hypothetical protein
MKWEQECIREKGYLCRNENKMKQMFETGDLVYWVIDGKKRTGTGVRSVMVAHFTSSKKERFDSILTLYKQKYL